jgi:hypothetical protein
MSDVLRCSSACFQKMIVSSDVVYAGASGLQPDQATRVIQALVCSHGSGAGDWQQLVVHQ